MIPIEHITGLVLAGGRGSRMGGVDKGLQQHRGLALALHAVQRLSAQVGTVAINANRNIDIYTSFGVPVWADRVVGQPGPLAGFLAGLEHCETPYLISVPCDAPNFPSNLVARLAAGLIAQDAQVAVAATREAECVQVHPVFCLMASSLRNSLVAFIHSGQRKVERWAASHRCATVMFDDKAAFANANTAQELRQLQTHAMPLGATQADNRADELPFDGLA